MTVNENLYNSQIAMMLGYTLVTPEMRKNPEKWSRSYWEKDTPYGKDVLCTGGNESFNSNWERLMKAIEFIKTLQKDWPQATSKVLDLTFNSTIEEVFNEVGGFAVFYNQLK